MVVVMVVVVVAVEVAVVEVVVVRGGGAWWCVVVVRGCGGWMVAKQIKRLTCWAIILSASWKTLLCSSTASMGCDARAACKDGQCFTLDII